MPAAILRSEKKIAAAEIVIALKSAINRGETSPLFQLDFCD
jgi:hypothetical protein